MSINQDNHCVIIAGATGLVGSRLLQHILQHDAIDTVYALSRRPPQVEHTGSNRVYLLLDPELKITAWDESLPRPTIGFICLGSTRKQAGSRAKLRQVDFELVCHVAQSMKVLGVSKLAVVSSLGADAHSPFHYLKCKGQMENALMQMEFEQLVIARPFAGSARAAAPRRKMAAMPDATNHSFAARPATQLDTRQRRHGRRSNALSHLQPSSSQNRDFAQTGNGTVVVTVSLGFTLRVRCLTV